MPLPYEEPPPPGASTLRRWVVRMGGGHPEELPPDERDAAPPRPGWRGTVLYGVWFAGLFGLSVSPWVAVGSLAITAVAATAEHWAWERADHEGPGWRPLGIAFRCIAASVPVWALVFRSEDLLFGGIAFLTPLASSVDQIGRGIRAQRDGAPRPVRDA